MFGLFKRDPNRALIDKLHGEIMARRVAARALFAFRRARHDSRARSKC